MEEYVEDDKGDTKEEEMEGVKAEGKLYVQIEDWGELKEKDIELKTKASEEQVEEVSWDTDSDTGEKGGEVRKK